MRLRVGVWQLGGNTEKLVSHIVKEEMTKTVMLEFSKLGEKIAIELDYSLSPKTVKAIIDILPITITINRWGDELYSDEILANAGEENAHIEQVITADHRTEATCSKRISRSLDLPDFEPYLHHR